MNLTSDGKRMLGWAQKNSSAEEHKEIFPPIDKSVSSYYEKREEAESLLYEYDFEDFQQIKAWMEELWAGEPIMKEIGVISAVSAMKYKKDGKKQEIGSGSIAPSASDAEHEIPEYVYIF